MKKIMILSGLALLASCGSEELNNKINDELNNAVKETVDEIKNEKTDFGPVKVNSDLAMTVDEMLKSNGADTTGNEFTFKGEITQVCSKAGCWANIKSGEGEEFMVRFKDHFTIPTETKPGTMAVLHGIGKMTETPVDLLKHFAEDAGKSQKEIDAITEPEYNFGFIADGIKLMK